MKSASVDVAGNRVYNRTRNISNRDVFESDAQERWRPGMHCSNCSHCRTYRDEASGDMMARCAQGYGKPKLLIQVIRPAHGRGWRQAKDCPDFDNMDDE